MSDIEWWIEPGDEAMKHITEPLSAKEIRDALGVTDEDLEAARRAIGGTMNAVTEAAWGAIREDVDVDLAMRVIHRLDAERASLQAEVERLKVKIAKATIESLDDDATPASIRIILTQEEGK